MEIPGILEVRKQVSRLFPFNDACQWFIDRADIIFLVYDPAKLDVGPETEAILDQLKGREYQTRIILNKADTVKPEELLRVQSALIWNISPLMSSAQPPLVYTTSLWSHPYQEGSPARLLLAQERAFLRDLRTAVDKRIENKIASARRFAVSITIAPKVWLFDFGISFSIRCASVTMLKWLIATSTPSTITRLCLATKSALLTTLLKIHRTIIFTRVFQLLQISHVMIYPIQRSIATSSV